MYNGSGVLDFVVGHVRANVSIPQLGEVLLPPGAKAPPGGSAPGGSPLGVNKVHLAGNKTASPDWQGGQLLAPEANMTLAGRQANPGGLEMPSLQGANITWRPAAGVTFSRDHRTSGSLPVSSTTFPSTDTYQGNLTRPVNATLDNVTDVFTPNGATSSSTGIQDSSSKAATGSLYKSLNAISTDAEVANKSLAYAHQAAAQTATTETVKTEMWTLPTPGWNGTEWSVNYTFDYLTYTDLGVNNSRSNATMEAGTATDSYNGTTMPTGYLSGYTTEHIILASIFVTALMIVIVVGNGLVIMAIAVDRNLRALQNWFIASLAVSDLLVGLLIMPFSLANELMGYWYFGNILCELWLATDVLLCTASILNLCLISLDRYWSITRAISYVKQRTKKRAAIMIALVWALSAIICFPPLVGWKRPQPTKYGLPLCVLSEDIGYVVYSTLGSFYIPLIVMVIVYFKIYLAARSRARRNLKKQLPKPVAENGKSTSTTTTSFSTPSRTQEAHHNKHEEEKDLSSNEESDHPSKGGSQVGSPEEDDKKATGYKLSVPGSHVHYRPIDEKRKLLSDDTDSACDSPVRRTGSKGAKSGKRIHFSEETDSTSDTTSSKLKFPNYKQGLRGQESNEENMKPLLEDSQLESDSQRESEKPQLENNNVESDKSVGDMSVDTSKEEGQPKVNGTGSSPKSPSGHVQAMDNKKMMLLSPSAFRRPNQHTRKCTGNPKEKHKRSHGHGHGHEREDPDKLKKKIARAKERRAFIVLGIIMATFILCWLPFFSTYLISSLTGLPVPYLVFAIFFWGGYCNSALNPVIYTIFNQDFRKAFHKIVCGRRAGY